MLWTRISFVGVVVIVGAGAGEAAVQRVGSYERRFEPESEERFAVFYEIKQILKQYRNNSRYHGQCATIEKVLLSTKVIGLYPFRGLYCT